MSGAGLRRGAHWSGGDIITREVGVVTRELKVRYGAEAKIDK